jgi:hypothetical protein
MTRLKTPMKIIALRGPYSCGKSTTLNLTYRELLNNGAKSKDKQPIGTNPDHFCDTLTWKGLTIGILTMGDYSYMILDCIKEYEQKRYNVFITACNDRFIKPYKKISNYPGSYIHNKVKAADPSLEASENAADAMLLARLV